jgi:hypothetical protein
VIQDSDARLFANIEAPFFSDGHITSLSSTHVLCNTEKTDYYLLIPAGRPGVAYQITVNGIKLCTGG